MSQSPSDTEEDLTGTLIGHVGELEDVLGIRRGFFSDLLLKEDDWSFVIKTHALIESALTRLLETRITPTIPSEFINGLTLSGGRQSKVQLLRLLELIDITDVRFVEGLSKIRNRLVHNIQHVSFVLRDYVAQLSAEDSLSFVTRACCIFYNERWPTENRPSRLESIKDEPRKYVWRTALFILGMTSLRIQNEGLKRVLEERERKQLEAAVERTRDVTTALAPNWALDLYQHELKKHQPDAGESAEESPSG